MSGQSKEAAAFTGLIDLAAEMLGGQALDASDEFFAPKENLLKPGRGRFEPDVYTDRGKWMDGWETRRRRSPGLDWCVIRLGLPGIIRGVDIDTNHFLGNNPSYASIDAKNGESGDWVEILPRVPLRPGAQNLFGVMNQTAWTHIRLNIYPDGGVARLRVYGDVAVDWRVLPDEDIDLACLRYGGKAVACSDRFFSPVENLILPGEAHHMGEGWETRRRRGPGYDWAIIQLGRAGQLHRIEINTRHFKGNYPDLCSLDGCVAPDEPVDSLTWPEFEWVNILPKTSMKPDHLHVFEGESISNTGPFTHVKLNVFPDGGVSRLRVYGQIAQGR